MIGRFLPWILIEPLKNIVAVGIATCSTCSTFGIRGYFRVIMTGLHSFVSTFSYFGAFQRFLVTFVFSRVIIVVVFILLVIKFFLISIYPVWRFLVIVHIECWHLQIFYVWSEGGNDSRVDIILKTKSLCEGCWIIGGANHQRGIAMTPKFNHHFDLIRLFSDVLLWLRRWLMAWILRYKVLVFQKLFVELGVVQSAPFGLMGVDKFTHFLTNSNNNCSN